MKNQKKLIKILLMLTLIVGVLYSCSKPPDSPPPDFKIAHWEDPPSVFICEDSALSKEDYKYAEDWWKAHGYSFFVTFWNFPCVYTADYSDMVTVGSIYIYPAYLKIDEDDLGRTSLYTDGFSGEAYGAIIELLIFDKRVLAHELGHALGFMHYNKLGHLMHPIYEDGGWDDLGLLYVPPKVE